MARTLIWLVLMASLAGAACAGANGDPAPAAGEGGAATQGGGACGSDGGAE